MAFAYLQRWHNHGDAIVIRRCSLLGFCWRAFVAQASDRTQQLVQSPSAKQVDKRNSQQVEILRRLTSSKDLTGMQNRRQIFGGGSAPRPPSHHVRIARLCQVLTGFGQTLWRSVVSSTSPSERRWLVCTQPTLAVCDRIRADDDNATLKIHSECGGTAKAQSQAHQQCKAKCQVRKARKHIKTGWLPFLSHIPDPTTVVFVELEDFTPETSKTETSVKECEFVNRASLPENRNSVASAMKSENRKPIVCCTETPPYTPVSKLTTMCFALLR